MVLGYYRYLYGTGIRDVKQKRKNKTKRAAPRQRGRRGGRGRRRETPGGCCEADTI